MNAKLDQIVKQINAGDHETAEGALRSLLKDEPQNVDAWLLLATLVPDPAGKSECYQQVLRIDPNHPRAAKRLNTLSRQRFQPQRKTRPPVEEKGIHCPQCSGFMEVLSTGDTQEQHAVCPYCHTTVDLPGSFQRRQAQRTQARSLGGARTVEETTLKTRRDGKADGSHASREAGLSGAGSLDSNTEETAQKGAAPWLESLLQDEPSETETRNQGFLSRLFGRRRKPKQSPDPLSLVKLIQLAGGGIPPEDRRQCPNPRCGATISKGATKCSWCGDSLPDSGK